MCAQGARAQEGYAVSWRDVEQTFGEAIEKGAIPGAVLIARRGANIEYQGAFGSRRREPEPAPMRLETVFDLSSLTKPLATAIAAMALLAEGKLKLDERISRYLPSLGVHGKGGVTFRHLLAHCSGLAAWRPFYERVAAIERGGRVNFTASRAARDFVYEEIHRERPEAPPGVRAIYSDLNFMLLGEALEQIGLAQLDRFCVERIYRPLGLRATGFFDLALARVRRIEPIEERFAATGFCPIRQRILCGEVDDENAYAMGGVAGHAGLFAPAAEIDRIAVELMAVWAGRSEFLPRKIVREFWTRDPAVRGSTWALGWDTPSPAYSSSGRYFSPAAVGHLGFTGTSIWIEPESEISIVLLTNRVHPRRDNQAIREFRPMIHNLAMAAMGAGG